MKTRFTCVVLASLLFIPAAALRAEDKKPPTSKPAEKSKSTSKLYRFKSQKTVGSGDGASMVLSVEDLITGKSDNVYVASANPEKYEPLPAVVDAIKNMPAGTPIEIATERQKGKPVAVAINKSPLAPGEDRPNVYVLVAWDKKKQADGKPLMAVKLKKFGREFTAMIPLVHNKETDDWAAPWGVEHTLSKVQPGEVLEATLTKSNPPMVKDMVLYRPPEQGKFVEFTEKEMDSGATAAAFKMLARDGITVTVTLPGPEKVVGGKKVLVPDAKQLHAVKSIKPDSEIEITLQPGDQYILREIKILKPTESAPDHKS